LVEVSEASGERLQKYPRTSTRSEARRREEKILRSGDAWHFKIDDGLDVATALTVKQPLELSVTRYEAGRSHGSRFSIKGSGEVIVDFDGETSAVTWPTDLEAFDTLLHLSVLFGIEVVEASVFQNDRQIAEHVSLNRLPSLQKKNRQGLEVVRVDDERTHISLVWQRSLSRGSSYYEAGVIAPHIDDQRLMDALEATGDQVVSSQARDITIAVARENG
jgi:hypothetical protein